MGKLRSSPQQRGLSLFSIFILVLTMSPVIAPVYASGGLHTTAPASDLSRALPTWWHASLSSPRPAVAASYSALPAWSLAAPPPRPLAADVAYIQIEDGAGQEVVTKTLTADQNFTFYAVGYNSVSSTEVVSWTLSANVGPLAPSPSASTTLEADTVGTAILTATLVTTPSISTTARITVIAGEVDHFALSVPVSGVAGLGFTTLITAQDGDNNLVSIDPTISLATTNGGDINPDQATLSAGSWSGALSLTAQGSGRTVQAISGTITGQATITIYAAALAVITVTPDTADVMVNTTQLFTASGADQYNNPVPVSPAWSTNGGSVDAGPSETSLFTAQPTPAVGRLVTATDEGIDGVAVVNVLHGPVDAFHVLPSQITTQTAGDDFTLTVEARDFYGNLATRYDGTADLDDSTGSIAPDTIPFSAGAWTGAVSITRAAAGVVITVTDGVTTGQSNGFTVLPAAPHRFSLTGYPVSVVAGDSFASSVVVTAYDAYDNVKTDYTGAVYFESDDWLALLPYTSTTPYSFLPADQGTHSFDGSGFELRKTVTRHITVTDGTVSQPSADITVQPAELERFGLTGYPSPVTAGESWDTYGATVVVTAYDPYDNVKTDYTGAVYFESDDWLARLPYTSTTPYNFLPADQGARGFGGSGFELRKTVIRHITVTNGTLFERSADIVVNPTVLDEFVILNTIGNQTAGDPFTLQVMALDLWDNAKTDYGSRPNLTDTTGTLLPTQTGVNCFWGDGMCVQSNLVITRAWDDVRITVADPGGVSAQSNSFDVSPAALDHIRINSAPDNGGAGYGYPIEVGAHTMDIYQTYNVWGAGYDRFDNYRGDLAVDWSLSGVLAAGEIAPPSGVWATFTPAPILSGTGTINATYDGLPDSTGLFEIQAPWLIVSKNDEPDPVWADTQLQYTIVYTNVGNAAAQDVVINEFYDENVDYAWSSPRPDNWPGPSDEWTLPTLGVNDSRTILLLVDVASSLDPGTLLNNLVTVSGSRLGQHAASATTVVTSTPDLTLTLTAQPNPVNAGSNLVYRIHYANQGTAAAHNVYITLTYDADVTFLSSSPIPPEPGTDNRVWLIPTPVEGGASGDIDVTVVVNDFMPDQHVLVSSATMKGQDPLGQDLPQFSDFAYTVVDAPLLALSKSASSDPVVAFNRLTYTLVYSNVGHGPASALRITDVVPANSDYVEASCQPAPCDENDGVVTWEPGSLGAGADGTVSMVVDVHRNLDSGTVLTNYARVHVFAIPDYSAAVQITTSVVSSPSLSLLISDGRDWVEAGDEVQYSLSYRNDGSGRSYGTTIVATPPLSQHVGDVGCVPSTDCVVSDGQLIYDLGTVAGGASGTVHMVARLHDPLPAGASAITATARISTFTPGDPLDDNADQDRDDIATRPDLQLQVHYSSHTPYPGKRITYTVHYSNAGHIATTGVVVTATQPPYATYDPDASSAWQPTGDGHYAYPLGALGYPGTGSLLFVVTLPTGTFTTAMSSFDAAFGIYDDGGSGLDSDPHNNHQVAHIGVPDLIVESVEVNWASLSSGQHGRHVTVTLRNLGDNIACNSIPPTGNIEYCSGFWVDLYFNPDPVPPSYPSDDYYGEIAKLGIIVMPQATRVVTFAFDSSGILAIRQPPWPIYVRVDNLTADPERPYGSVPEYNEWNNVFGPVVPDYSAYLPVVMRNH